MIDALFWWTGCIAWTLVAVLVVAFGLPDGRPHKGVTVIAFYGFGPVIWRLQPANHNIFNRLKECGYHFAHIGGAWHLGLILPGWFSRLVLRQKHDAGADSSRGGEHG